MDKKAEESTSQESTVQEPEIMSSEDIRGIMNFDPFAEGMSGDTERSGEEASSEEEAETQEGEGTAASTEEGGQQQETVVAPPVEDATAKAIREQNDLVRQQLALIHQQKAEGDKSKEPKDDLPPYLFNLDDALINAVRSEDPSHTKLALQHIIKEIGRIVHKNVRDEYQPYVREHVGKAVQQYYKAQNTQKEIESDFYGKFPQLNTPYGRQLVVAAANEVMQGAQDQTWTAAIRDKIAEVALENARLLAGQPAGGQTAANAAAAGQNTQKQRPKVPVQTTPTTRPAVKQPESQVDDISDTLFGS